jgi:arylsulfatase A-like enzyme
MRSRCFAGFGVAIAVLAGCSRSPSEQPVNVLVILSDDQGYGDVGYQGSPDIPTPHIDSIAKNGVRFSNGYVSAPQCAPSRAGLLTGRYQNRFGFEENLYSIDMGLPASEVTFGDRMRAAGRVTGLIGKWHVGTQAGYHPLDRGFDEFFGFLGALSHYLPPEGLPGIPGILRGREPALVTDYLTDAFGREAVSFIERHQHQPFFLLLAFNAPHEPMQAPPAALERFARIEDPTRRTYAAMVASMDDAIGEVLAKIAACGLEERTLIFFLSDNGGAQGKRWTGASNAPFRGGKGETLEGGIRVPFLAQWKGRLPAGGVFDAPVIALDLLPTALAAAGVAAQPEWQLDGVNLLPYLTGEIETAPHDVLFWRFLFRPKIGRNFFAIRQGDWKLVSESVRIPGRERAFRSDPKLFDLRADPHEDRDRRDAESQRADALAARWAAWDAGLMPPGGVEDARRPAGENAAAPAHP